jgi:uncharacterized membrane protein
MTAVATGMHGTRSSRWLMPVLVASLALNLVVIGAAGSLLWRGYRQPPEALGPLGRRLVPTLISYSATLAPERRRELDRLTTRERQTVIPLRRALVAARAEVNKALTAQPFDQTHYLAAYARMVEADKLSREASFKLQVALSLHFTPEERLGYLRWRETQRLPENPLDAPDPAPGDPPR